MKINENDIKTVTELSFGTAAAIGMLDFSTDIMAKILNSDMNIIRKVCQAFACVTICPILCVTANGVGILVGEAVYRAAASFIVKDE